MPDGEGKDAVAAGSGEKPRPLGAGERVVKLKAAPKTDLFEEVLTGKSHEEQSLDELSEAEEKRAQEAEKTVATKPGSGAAPVAGAERGGAGGGGGGGGRGGGRRKKRILKQTCKE